MPALRMGAKERANAVRILRQGRAKLRGSTERAARMYAVSLVVCDARGRFSLAEVREGMEDPRVVQLADDLLREAGVTK